MPAAPDDAHAAAAAELARQPEHLRELFGLRLDRWWDDLADGLEAAHGPDGHPLALRTVALAAAAYRDRDPDLRRLDLRRGLEPDWLQSPRTVGYAAYADRFAGGLAGVREQIPYLRELGVTYLHLMPVLASREDDDGGYAVSDFRGVRPDLGTVEDLRALTADLRGAGISLVLDLVLNHVAREHAWAVQARAGSARHRAYFHVFPDRVLADAHEQTLPEVFPATAPGSFTWDEELGGWVWTTFNRFQWDVAWSNPEVFVEYVDAVLWLAGLGVEVLRLDAIAFLWKRLGTPSQNQPEVHALTQALRATVRMACPAVAFLAEAIVGPADLVQYLGSGRHHGRVSDLAYHNGLMVQVWSMLATGEVGLAVQALRALPPVPTSTAWVTYARGHDDIGWAVDDADAAAVGLDGPAHRAFLSDWYCGAFPGSPARGLVFQEDAATGDRRISGTLATLAGLAAASSPDEVDLAVARVLLAHALVLGWGGVPVLWSGDELGSCGDPDWAAEPGHAGDNRWAHRPRLDRAAVARRADPATVAGRVFTGTARLAAVRAGLVHLHASVAAEVLDPVDPGVLAVLRQHPVGPMLGLYNVTAQWRPWPLDRVGLAAPYDAIGGQRVHPGGDGQLWLPPYAARWLVEQP